MTSCFYYMDVGHLGTDSCVMQVVAQQPRQIPNSQLQLLLVLLSGWSLWWLWRLYSVLRVFAVQDQLQDQLIMNKILVLSHLTNQWRLQLNKILVHLLLSHLANNTMLHHENLFQLAWCNMFSSNFFNYIKKNPKSMNISKPQNDK